MPSEDFPASSASIVWPQLVPFPPSGWREKILESASIEVVCFQSLFNPEFIQPSGRSRCLNSFQRVASHRAYQWAKQAVLTEPRYNTASDALSTLGS